MSKDDDGLAPPGPRAGIAHPHPWCGSLVAAHWHALAPVHNGVHRRHVERIAKAR